MDELIDKMWSTHTMEYYAAMKREVLIYAAIRMNLKHFMLSERKPDTKDHILYESIYKKYLKQVRP